VGKTPPEKGPAQDKEDPPLVSQLPNMQWVYEAVAMGDPLNYTFKSCLRTLNIIRSAMARERGIELSESAVSMTHAAPRPTAFSGTIRVQGG
jgi:hypothetical protein